MNRLGPLLVGLILHKLGPLQPIIGQPQRHESGMRFSQSRPTPNHEPGVQHSREGGPWQFRTVRQLEVFRGRGMSVASHDRDLELDA